MKKNYELIEHTADIGIKVKGKDLKELFRNIAVAVFDIMAERQKKGSGRTEKIKIEEKADDLEELFINWLNELLSLSSARELVFSGFQINKLDENVLEALAIGDDISNYKVNVEIKAATYHELRIGRNKTGWQAQVILDV